MNEKILEVYTLIAGIVLCVLCFMMIVWTKNFIIMRYEWFHKLIRKKEIKAKYKELSIYFAILYFITAIPLVTIAILGFVIIIPDKTYFWIYIADAGFGLIAILYANISKQFIQPLEQTAETV